jgi:hypothetical protein
MRLRWGVAATVVLCGCALNWDAFDPRLAASSTGAGGGGAVSGNGGSGGSTSSGGAAGAQPGTYRDIVLADGPVGYWRFGEAPAATMASDESASGFSGTYLGGVTLGVAGAIAGDADSAAHFDGVDDEVQFGDVLDFPGLAPFSVEVWILPDDTQPNQYGTISAKQFNAVDGFELGIEGSTQTVFFGREVAGMSSDPAVGATLKLYINGVEMHSIASQLVLPDNPAPLTAGDSFESSEQFAGTIDELAIYDAVLAPSRIAAHYAAGTAP